MAESVRVPSRRNLERYRKQLDRVRETRQGLAAAKLLDPRKLSREEQAELYGALTEQKRERALDDLFFFDKYILGYREMEDQPRRFLGAIRPGVHRELCDFVQERDEWGRPYEKNLILEPRGSFKSSCITIGYSLWRVLQQPNLRVLITSEEYGKSRAFNREIRDHIQHNDELRRLFGALDAKRHRSLWTEAQFNVATRTIHRKEPTFSCAGIDVTKVGMHYDLIIADDLISDKNVATREQRHKALQYYRLLLSLLDPGGELIFIGTRWDWGDLYGHLLEMDEKRARHDEATVWRTLIRPSTDEDGNLLFPSRLTEGFLAAQKTEQGSYLFSAQYQNNPSGVENAAFNRNWIQWVNELPPGLPYNFVVILDPSVGMKNDSDNSAIVSVAIDPLNNWYVLHVDRGIWNPTQIVDRLARARRRLKVTYKCNPKVGMETVAFQRTLAFYAKDLMARHIIERFTIHELKTDTHVAKEQRIRQLVPHFENGKVSFKGREAQHSDGMATLVKEIEQFPKGQTVDCLDALAYVPQLATTPHEEVIDHQPTFWQKIIEDRNYRGRYGRRTDVVGSRFRRQRGVLDHA